MSDPNDSYGPVPGMALNFMHNTQYTLVHDDAGSANGPASLEKSLDGRKPEASPTFKSTMYQ